MTRSEKSQGVRRDASSIPPRGHMLDIRTHPRYNGIKNVGHMFVPQLKALKSHSRELGEFHSLLFCLQSISPSEIANVWINPPALSLLLWKEWN